MQTKRSRKSGLLFAGKKSRLLVSMLAAFAAAEASATLINMQDFFVRDYLDFAQNKGVFTPGATGIELTKKDGTTWAIPNLPFIDFSVGSNDATSTAIGGAYVVTAEHYFSGTGTTAVAHPVVKTPLYGKTTYNFVEVKKNYDFAVERLDKFIVETGGTATADISSMSDEELKARYGVEVNGETRVLGFHAGTGEIRLKYSTEGDAYDHDYRAQSVGNNEVFKNGGIFEITENDPGSATIHVLMEDGTFINRTTSGDSGSGYFLYDKVAKQWVLIGPLFGTMETNPVDTVVDRWSQSTVEALQSSYVRNIALEGGTLEFNNGDLTLNGSAEDPVTSATDLWFTGGGSLVLRSDMIATEGGYGLVFDDGQSYSVSGDFSYKGAGLDIGSGTTVEWNVTGTAGDSLHKIGAGTLNVNVSQGNALRLGEGRVNLNAAGAFENIYVTSGRGTITVNHEAALGTGGYGGVFFHDRGGLLDLNGYDWTLDRIAANDTGATITNSNNDRTSSVNLSAADKYAYHGTLVGNVDVKHVLDAESSEQRLIFDGGFDITGNVTAENSNIVLQGKPVAHAVFGNAATPNAGGYTSAIIGQETDIAEDLGMGWMVSNSISTFDQPDWEDRVFKAETVKLSGGSLTIARNAQVAANIDATGAVVTLGGSSAWRDAWDGENVTGDGFSFRQEVIQGESEANDTISYNGVIKATESDVISRLSLVNAALDLNAASYTDETGSGILNVREEGLKLTNGSVVTVPTVLVQNLLDVHIDVDSNSVLNVDTLRADNSVVYLNDASRTRDYMLNAVNGAYLHVGDWTYAPGNLTGDAESRFVIGKLTADAGERIEAQVEIADRLDIRNMSARLNQPLSLLGLTLDYASKVGVSFDDETISSQNYAFDTAYTVLTADTLNDTRGDKSIEVTLPGEGITASSDSDGNSFTVTFERVPDPTPDPGTDPDPEPEPTPDPEPSRPDSTAVKAHLSDHESALLAMIEEHNLNSSAKWQEVAVESALTNPDPAAGAASLRAQALKRTDATMARIAQTVDAGPLLYLMGSVVERRIATRGMKWRETKLRDTSVFADINAGYMREDSGRDTKVYGITAGFDKEFTGNGGRLVLGAVFGAGNYDRTAVGFDDESTVLSVAGYADWRPNDLTEVYGSVSLGYADSEKKVLPDVNVESQKLDDDTVAFMVSGAMKHQVWASENDRFMVKPLIKADFGWFKTSSAESEFFKRESADGMRMDLSIGVEAEMRDFRNAQVFRAAVRKNVADTLDEVDVKLSGASSSIDYAIREDHSAAALDMSWFGNWKLSRKWTMTTALQGTVDTDSAWGAFGNVGLQYRW